MSELSDAILRLRTHVVERKGFLYTGEYQNLRRDIVTVLEALEESQFPIAGTVGKGGRITWEKKP